MRTLLIARLTFDEAFRRKMILAVLLLSLVFLALYVFGFRLLHDDLMRYRQERLGRPDELLPYDVQASAMVLLGLYTVNFLAGIMTIFAAVGSISGEIEAGTLQSILPKPISRWEIIAGKYLGFLAMIAVYLGLMVGGVILASRVVGHYMPPNVFRGLLLMILVSAILLALTMLGSTVFSTMANGIVVLMLYGMALTGGLVEQRCAAESLDVAAGIERRPAGDGGQPARADTVRHNLAPLRVRRPLRHRLLRRPRGRVGGRVQSARHLTRPPALSARVESTMVRRTSRRRR